MKGLLRITHYMSGGLWVIPFDFGFPLLFCLLPFGKKPDSSLCMFIVMYISVMTGMMPVAAQKAASVSRWKTYMKTLPYTRRQQVDAKYLYSLLTVIPAVLAALLTLPIVLRFNPDMLSEFPYAPPAALLMLVYGALTAAVILLMAAFLHPLSCIRRGGIRTVLVSIAAAAPFTFIYISIFAYFSSHLYRCKWEPISKAALLIPFLLLALAVICYPLSWRLSRRLYCRKRKKVTA